MARARKRPKRFLLLSGKRSSGPYGELGKGLVIERLDLPKRKVRLE
ncbi:hypothetical protein [Candidatus Methylacidithermus pantelleriae]|nr:hypothetical protein [Candidatus Methylacidithermus pantelleriae]